MNYSGIIVAEIKEIRSGLNDQRPKLDQMRALIKFRRNLNKLLTGALS